MIQLEELAVKYNTDKAKFCHNYMPIYDALFSPIKDDVKNVLEIGISECASIRAWRDFFTNAQIHGTDIVDYPDISLREFGERIHCHNCDQSDRQAMIALMEKINVKFDIMIDDGDHDMNHILISLDAIFPYLKEGGLYIIEDMEFPRRFDEHLTKYNHWWAQADSEIMNSNLIIIKK